MANPILTENNRVIRLPPGFRFRPTDDELVAQYLTRKALSKPLPANIIIEIDLGKHDPWDLPGVNDGEGYFFSLRGRYTRAAAPSGYWKATGRARQVMDSGQVVGMKKVLRFYHNGSRTDWIMHEYRLASGEGNTSRRRLNSKCIKRASTLEIKEWVACRILKKERAARVVSERALSSSSLSCLTEVFECSDGEDDSINSASTQCVRKG
uniref:NAC protein n=1 Tax=Lilium pumilum TaxID=82327 RepID=A0A4Y1P0P1_9LILI|nr:NAC protein [Lilium pumilum]